jgi:hypothetical protein
MDVSANSHGDQLFQPFSIQKQQFSASNRRIGKRKLKLFSQLSGSDPDSVNGRQRLVHWLAIKYKEIFIYL